MKAYPKYKPSNIEWIGEIPENWEVKKLKYLSIKNVQYGLNIGSEFYLNNGIRFLRTTDIDDKGNLSDEGVFLSEKEVESNYILNIGDFLISRSGTIGRAYVHQKNDIKYSYAGYLVRFCFNNIYLSKFIYYFTKTTIFFNWLNMNSIEATIGNVNGQKYANFSIQLPPNNELNHIVTYLDDRTQKIGSLIEKKQKLIDLLKEERLAIINQAITKGLNPNAPMKDSGIEWLGEIPKHWEAKRLKYVSYINPIKSNMKPEKSPEDLVTFLPMEKVSEDGQIDIEIKRPIKDLLNGFTYFEENDVIVAKITPCFENGKGALIRNLGSKVGFGSTEFHVLRTRENIIIKEYLYYLTKSDFFMKLGESSMTGAAGQKRVPTSFLDNFVTCFPNELEEQNLIVNFIENEMTKNDNIIAKIEKEIALLQEYHTALISEVITGKIDVRGEAV